MIKLYMQKLFLKSYSTVFVRFENSEFKIEHRDSNIRIALDENNYAIVSLKNQKVLYKMVTLGGFSLSEEIVGSIDYHNYFLINWDDDQSSPVLNFIQNPLEIRREYLKGQRIELDVENVPCYHVVYKDKVTADFSRVGKNAYDFNFSTGFNGNIRKDPDGSHSIKFRGIRLDAEDDGYDSESKFIISRSKYTDNLILILQEDASVFLQSRKYDN